MKEESGQPDMAKLHREGVSMRKCIAMFGDRYGDEMPRRDAEKRPMRRAMRAAMDNY